MRDACRALMAAELWPENRKKPETRGGSSRSRAEFAGVDRENSQAESLPLEPGSTSAASDDRACGLDLLPLLAAAWGRAAECKSGAAAKRAARTLQQLRSAEEGGAVLSWGVPGIAGARFDRWLGDRIVWWPRGVPPGRRIGLVSSRLGRNLDRQQGWFSVLRTACMKLDPDRDLLVTSDSIASHRFVQRCGALFGVPVLNVLVARSDPPALRRWARRVLAAETAAPDSCHCACVSPPLSQGIAGREDADLAELPLADRLVTAICDQLIALRVRTGGNLERLLSARLNQTDFPPASLFLALGAERVGRATAGRLMDRGAVGWYVSDPRRRTRGGPSPSWNRLDAKPARSAAPIICCPADDGWPYLTHCTRRQFGPWPDEEENAYLDDLILDRSGADHSAFASLWRIVRSARLLATRGLIRGDTAVVSFTAVPLSQIHRLRTFRSHLGRWDFEPYGICIRRDWLQERETAPVRYGDPPLWQTLPEEQRPLFQKKQSTSRGGAVIDWTVEQEWRHIGDLCLSEIPRHAAILFVPSRVEAEQLAAISRWPVAVVSPEAHREDR